MSAQAPAKSLAPDSTFGAELRQYDRDVVAQLRRLKDAALTADERAAIASGTTLRAPATALDVDALAKRMGRPLPPSYRAYLEASNGMLFEGALNRVTMLPAAEVVPLSKSAYPGLGVWLAMPDVAVPLDPAAGGPLAGAALQKAWVISSIEDGDVYLILPELASPDGEWPVWFFGPKNPGAIGYGSFRAMLERERAPSLRALEQRARL